MKPIVSENERNNICYMCLKYGIGWDMRGADFAVVNQMAPPEATREEFVGILAEYAWDHLMGEPGLPTQKKVESTMNQIMRKWIEVTTPEQREDIG